MLRCLARFALLVSVGLLGCGEAVGGNNTNDRQDGGLAVCDEGAQRCFGLTWQVCDEGSWQVGALCLWPTPHCDVDQGCLRCPPGERYCEGDDATLCTPQGTAGTLLDHCDDATGEGCAAGVCVSACEAAADRRGYIGCDYWPTPVLNLPLPDDFADNFGVAVHNGGAIEAHVSMERGDVVQDQATLAPGALHTFLLPLDTGLQDGDGVVYASAKVPDAAYHLTATVPVTVYQFNPLDYELGGNHSYSNDASLLLPTHALSGHYLALSRATSGVRPVLPDGQMFFTPGFVTVVGTAVLTHVTVALSAHIAAGAGVAAGAPGDVVTYTLGRGEALQLVSAQPETCTGTLVANTYCDQGPRYDLTGTLVTADAPVAVFGGHAGAFVPFDVWAADHLEEQLPPLKSWGKRFVVARTVPQHDSEHPPEPNVVRLLSGEDGNVVRFDPPHPELGGTLTLARGQWRELLVNDDVYVEASGPLLVAQLLVGQEAYAVDWHVGVGDPSLSLVVPIEQHRSQYTFLAPSTIPVNYVNVVKRVGAGAPLVTLDGAPVDEALFSAPVGQTSYGVARLPITGTAHRLSCAEPVGLVVYGFAPYTSYFYPGGMDILPINPVL